MRTVHRVPAHGLFERLGRGLGVVERQQAEGVVGVDAVEGGLHNDQLAGVLLHALIGELFKLRGEREELTGVARHAHLVDIELHLGKEGLQKRARLGGLATCQVAFDTLKLFKDVGRHGDPPLSHNRQLVPYGTDTLAHSPTTCMTRTTPTATQRRHGRGRRRTNARAPRSSGPTGGRPHPRGSQARSVPRHRSTRHPGLAYGAGLGPA